MDLTLKNIAFRGDNNSIIYLTLNAIYGHNSEMYNDNIKLIYNRTKKKAYVTVDAENPGVGHIVERIIESLNKIDFNKKNLTKDSSIIEIIADTLARVNNMKYDPELVRDAEKQISN